jgi:membrane-bound lytic murein transglycosylase D
MAPGDVLSVRPRPGRLDQGTGCGCEADASPALPPVSGGAAPVAAAISARSTTVGFATPGTDSMIRQVTYVVRRGDSLSSIARRFRVTVANLLEWNEVNTAKYLQPGQRLVMFVNVLEQSG